MPKTLKISAGAPRAALVRVLRVAGFIRLGKGELTAFGFAARLEVCDKTIRRDLECLKEMGAPIYFNYTTNQWIWNPLIPVPWYFGGNIEQPKFLEG